MAAPSSSTQTAPATLGASPTDRVPQVEVDNLDEPVPHAILVPRAGLEDDGRMTTIAPT